MANQGPARLVETLTERISALEIEFHKAYWDSQVDATEENEKKRADLELELRRSKGDPEALAQIEDALEGELHDPLVGRQLEVLRLSFTSNQMDETQRKQIVELSSAVESDFASFRPTLGDKKVSDNEIDDVLRLSNDEGERRAAWEASKEIGGVVAPRVRELARLRNQAARKLGFSDYYRMSWSCKSSMRPGSSICSTSLGPSRTSPTGAGKALWTSAWLPGSGRRNSRHGTTPTRSSSHCPLMGA